MHGRGHCPQRLVTLIYVSRSCVGASFFPLILELRRRIDQALYVVVVEAYVADVFTRSVDAPRLVDDGGDDNAHRPS